VPGDLLDPLFTCWALGWNFHAMGLTAGGPRPASYWDANIFHPTPRALARSEHFAPQAAQGAAVYAATGDLLLTYNLLFLATFVLSGTFLYLLARDETGDPWAALAGGAFYAFALFRWAQVEHLGALSSQWMPLALLLARRTARAAGTPAAAWTAALALAVATQVTSSGYYLLFFPPLLALWAAVEAARAGGLAPWLRLAAAGALAVLLALPLVLPYVALRAGGAERDLASVVDHSADLMSWLTAPEMTRLWGPVLDAFPRGEARTFPGLAVPLLAAAGLLGAWRAARGVVAPSAERARRALGAAAVLLLALGLAAAAVALGGGWSGRIGPVPFRVMGMGRPAFLLAAGLGAALAAWPASRRALHVFTRRHEPVAAALAVLAAWLSLGPIVTWRGWPVPLPSAYAFLHEYAPGFSAGRAPARFAMIAACFAALAAAWGVAHLRRTRGGAAAAAVLSAAFLAETAAAPLPVSRQWDMEGVAAPPRWHGGPSPIVGAIRLLPPEAVLAALPFGAPFHEARAMFDSAHHFRRMLNGYSSWTPREHAVHAVALRDPLRDAPRAVAALRAAGATHVLVDESAWARDRGPRVTARLVDAGAVPVAREAGIALLALP
jgi:hypothetical protein